MLAQQPRAFMYGYSQSECKTLTSTMLAVDVCTKLSRFDVVFGDGTYSNSGSSNGCPAPAPTATASDPSTGQTVNRLTHCCSAEAAADKCPVWANDSLWAGTAEAPSSNGTTFVTNTGSEGTAWANVTSGATRFESTNVGAVLGAWFSQLPVKV